MGGRAGEEAATSGGVVAGFRQFVFVIWVDVGRLPPGRDQERQKR